MNETSRAKRLIKLLERLLKKRELYDEDKLKLIKEPAIKTEKIKESSKRLDSNQQRFAPKANMLPNYITF